MITTPKSVSVTSAGIQESVSFGIKADGLAHIFNVLRNQLYSDKILAVMREYSANAVDANVEAGKSLTPITVTLPNRMSLNFKVRDNGSGLSDEDIRDVYAFYGESTKRNSNALIGQLGLGSKSAFAYGDNFVINSFVGGVKNIYNAFIDDSQVGQIAKLGSEKTSEQDGVEIVIGVRPEDVNAFTEKAKVLYRHFKVRPEIKGSTITFDDSIPILQTEGWKIRGNGTAFAVMGNIAYPIDDHSLNISGDEGNKIYSTVNQAGLSLSFEIGDLDVSASREKLQYTKRTIDNIVKRVTAVLADASKLVSKRFEDCKTVYDAKALYGEFFQYNGSLNCLRDIVKDVKWNGKKIDAEDISIDTKLGSGTILRRYQKSWRSSRVNSHEHSRINCSLNTVIILNDGNIKNGIINRVYNLVVNDKKAVFVITTDNLPKILSDTGLELSNLVKLSSLPSIPIPTSGGGTSSSTVKSTKHTNKAFVFDKSKADSYTSTLSTFWKEADVDLVNDSGVYVEIERFEFRRSASSMFENPRGISEIIKTLTAAGVAAPTLVYGFKPSVMEKIKKNKGFVSLQTFAKNTLEAHLNKTGMTQKITDRIEYDLHKADWWSLTCVAKLLSKKDGYFATFIAKIVHCEGNKADKKSIESAVSACKAMSVSAECKPTHDLATANKEIIAKYPMIFKMDSHRFHYDVNNIAQHVADYINLVDSAS